MTPKPVPPDQIKALDPESIGIYEYWGSSTKPPSLIRFLGESLRRLLGKQSNSGADRG
jgi:hypothetical protein